MYNYRKRRLGIVEELKVVFYKYFKFNIPKPKLTVYPLNLLLLLCSYSVYIIPSLPDTWIQTFEITLNFFLFFIPKSNRSPSVLDSICEMYLHHSFYHHFTSGSDNSL